MRSGLMAARRLMLAVFCASVTACGGGGGDGGGGNTPVTPVPPAADPFGRLAVTGSGGSAPADFVPYRGDLGSPTGPTCTPGLGCASTYSVGWRQAASNGMVVIFRSITTSSPGSAPGVAVTSVQLLYEPAGQIICGDDTDIAYTCSLASAGVVLNAATRTVTFSNTHIGSMTLNGTLTY